jgi:hypothetical protein
MSQDKKPIFKKWWFWLGAFFLITFVAAAASGPSETQTSKDNSQQEQNQAVFNGPHILSLTIDEVRDEYGMPNETSFVDPTQEQIDLGTISWSNKYTLDGYSILIDWDVASREVTGFFVSTDDSSGKTKDWERLAAVAGLVRGVSDYSIEPIEANKYPGYYTGINVKE